MTKRHCIGECDYSAFFRQSGKGLDDIKIYRGYPYQRGQGIGSLFKRFGIPLAKWLAKHVLHTGVAMGSDYLVNKNLDKATLRNHIRAAVKNAATDGLDRAKNLVNQMGRGKRLKKSKKLYKPNKKIKKPMRRKHRKHRKPKGKRINDIFS